MAQTSNSAWGGATPPPLLGTNQMTEILLAAVCAIVAIIIAVALPE